MIPSAVHQATALDRYPFLFFMFPTISCTGCSESVSQLLILVEYMYLSFLGGVTNGLLSQVHTCNRQFARSLEATASHWASMSCRGPRPRGARPATTTAAATAAAASPPPSGARSPARRALVNAKLAGVMLASTQNLRDKRPVSATYKT